MNGEKHLNMLAEVMPPEVLAKVRAEIENGRARDVLGATTHPDWAHEYIDTYEYTEGAFDPEDPGNQADIPDGLKQKFILDNSEQ